MLRAVRTTYEIGFHRGPPAVFDGRDVVWTTASGAVGAEVWVTVFHKPSGLSSVARHVRQGEARGLAIRRLAARLRKHGIVL